VYFYNKTGQLAIQYAGNRDKIMPMYIDSAMPDIIIVLFLLTLLAAAMSTLSSLFHTMGSAAGTDLWSQIKNRKVKDESRSDVPSLKANRIATMLIIVVTLLLAFQMPSDIIAIATAMFMGLCAAAFLPMLTYGLFVKRPSKIAAMCSLIVGAIVWFLWAAFVYSKDSDVFGLSQMIFGKDTIAGLPWMNIDPLVIAVPASVLALIAGWAIERYATKNKKVDAEDA
jgi:SSS family solute:Na+ symporter